jgi:succinate dehydrogenase/fumarate reductase flavoprotein subunit
VYGKGDLNMPRITPERRAIITQYVTDCNVWRLTAEETAEYLASKGFPLDARTVKKYRAKIRASAGEWIAKLAMNKRNDYIAEYRKRADELEYCMYELCQIIKNKNTHPRTKVEAIGKIMDCSSRLSDLYDRAPVVAAIRDTNTIRQKQQEQKV